MERNSVNTFLKIHFLKIVFDEQKCFCSAIKQTADKELYINCLYNTYNQVVKNVVLYNVDVGGEWSNELVKKLRIEKHNGKSQY